MSKFLDTEENEAHRNYKTPTRHGILNELW